MIGHFVLNLELRTEDREIYRIIFIFIPSYSAYWLMNSIIRPTYAQIMFRIKLILKSLRNVSVLIHHLQGVYKLCELK